MIALQRDRTKVKAAFRGTQRVARELKLLTAKRGGTLNTLLKNSLWKPAKEQLKVESSGKCAYCEAPASVVAHCDVEHVRPKSLWWWLACCYDNYVFACQICNQSFKGDNFPIGAAQHAGPSIAADTTDARLVELSGQVAPDPVDQANGYTYTAYRGHCDGERALLINPYEEDPEKLLAYDAIPALREVRVIPLQPAADARIKACEDFYGLNRETLAKERWNIYETLEAAYTAWKTVEAAHKPSIAAIIATMTPADKAYAGMCRYFVRKWQIPGI